MSCTTTHGLVFFVYKFPDLEAQSPADELRVSSRVSASLSASSRSAREENMRVASLRKFSTSAT